MPRAVQGEQECERVLFRVPLRFLPSVPSWGPCKEGTNTYIYFFLDCTSVVAVNLGDTLVGGLVRIYWAEAWLSRRVHVKILTDTPSQSPPIFAKGATQQEAQQDMGCISSQPWDGLNEQFIQRRFYKLLLMRHSLYVKKIIIKKSWILSNCA